MYDLKVTFKRCINSTTVTNTKDLEHRERNMGKSPNHTVSDILY